MLGIGMKNKKVENFLFYGIPISVVLLIVCLFIFRTPRHVSDRKKIAFVYQMMQENRHQEAFPIIGKKARLNNCDAQFLLYKFYMEGKYVKKDEKAALRWLQESARSGHPAAQHFWGLHLLKSNPEKGEFYLKSAIKAGYKMEN